MPDGTEIVPAPDRGTLQVGDWTVEPALGRLTAAGKTVKLEPKAMAVLVYLANRPGEVLGRETLLSTVWAGAVVGDDSLTQVVLKLRKALGDVRESPAYIETISKRGYRLIAPVVRSQNIVIAPVRRESHDSPPSRNRKTWWWPAVGACAVLLAAAGVWWIGRAADATERQAFTSSAVAPMTQPTVTINPFEALGGDPQVALLAAGMTADLVTDLSKVSGLSVVASARSDAQARGEGPADRYLVSGSVQRVAERLRVHVNLADAASGQQLWSERFDGPLSGFFAMQEELGPKILQILPAKVSEAEMRRVSQRHTRNLEAYEYFQRGQSALQARQQVENETARQMFRQAIALDATFARAYAGLARTYAADYRQQWTSDDTAALNRAFELARTAQEMNPDLPETDWVLAYVYMQRREHKQALRQLETTVRRNPSFADGYALMGAVATFEGRAAQGIALVRTAMRLQPEGSMLYFVTLGRAYVLLGDLEQARINLERALSRNPRQLEARVYMAALHLLSGDRSAALWEAEEIRALQPDFSSSRWLASYPMTDGAQKTKLMHALRELGL
jgi:DNA-binding winged helix-turn-helix (wHTH) protein/TolB-like protein/cytochrome c-type biogenesis protein CcmH/NrfG